MAHTVRKEKGVNMKWDCNIKPQGPSLENHYLHCDSLKGTKTFHRAPAAVVHMSKYILLLETFHIHTTTSKVIIVLREVPSITENSRFRYQTQALLFLFPIQGLSNCKAWFYVFIFILFVLISSLVKGVRASHVWRSMRLKSAMDQPLSCCSGLPQYSDLPLAEIYNLLIQLCTIC